MTLEFSKTFLKRIRKQFFISTILKNCLQILSQFVYPSFPNNSWISFSQWLRTCFFSDCPLLLPLTPSTPAGKIDMVKSKWGLALAAVVTVLSSLLMSVGLCTLFGLTPTLNGG